MELNVDQVVEIAYDLLTSRYGGAPELSDVTVLSGSGQATVVRAKVAPSAFLPHRSVVIKYTPVSGNLIDDAALLREVVAYQFTTSLPEEVRPGPVLLAYDMEQRILVLSDAGDSDTLIDLLTRAGDEQRLNVLRSLGTELGQMHAGTAGRESDYNALLNRMLRQYPEFGEMQKLRDDSLRASIAIGADLIAEAGVVVPDEVRRLAITAQETLQSGHELAFTPFDLSPDNVIVGKRVHFLDYEWAGFRNACFDVACVVAGFPQFLFARSISDAEAAAFQAAWAREVRGVWPGLADKHVQDRLVVACMIGWAFSSVATMFAGSLDGVVDLAQGAREEYGSAGASFLRSPDRGPFTEEDKLIRRDLYETFEALMRFAGHWGDPESEGVSSFAQEMATRLGPHTP